MPSHSSSEIRPNLPHCRRPGDVDCCCPLVSEARPGAVGLSSGSRTGVAVSMSKNISSSAVMAITGIPVCGSQVLPPSRPLPSLPPPCFDTGSLPCVGLAGLRTACATRISVVLTVW